MLKYDQQKESQLMSLPAELRVKISNAVPDADSAVNLALTSQKGAQDLARNISSLLHAQNEQALPLIISLLEQYPFGENAKALKGVFQEVINELGTNIKTRGWLVALKMTDWETKISNQWEKLSDPVSQILRNVMTEDEKHLLKLITSGDFSQENLQELKMIYPHSYEQIFVYCIVHGYLDRNTNSFTDDLKDLNQFQPETLYQILSPHFNKISLLASKKSASGLFFLRDIAACFNKEVDPLSSEKMISFFVKIPPQKMVEYFDWEKKRFFP